MKIVEVKSGWLKQKWHFRIYDDSGNFLASSKKFNDYEDMQTAYKRIQSDIAKARIEDYYYND